MPEYIYILRQTSVYSIYALLVLVVLLSIFRKIIRDKELIILFYVWLPIAVITQLLMTYFRLSLGKSNYSVMNIYLMIEFALIIFVLLNIREKAKNIKTNYKFWTYIIIVGILLHFLNEFDKLHNPAMLFMAVVYFNLSVNFIDLEKIEKLFTDPYSLIHIAIFTKAFGYSYFLIYQIDYKFPLVIYSVVNLIVQALFGISIIIYFINQKKSQI